MTCRPNLLSYALLALAASAYFGLGQGETDAQDKKPQPKVEVVFVLDTTGSMGGLIDAAKQKIWSISNQIASGKPTPAIKIGLVAFRDRGDAYVTKIYDLTDNLDAVHGNLMTFKAEGGGDTPESVNQALYEAVTKISWSKDKGTLRLIFLVGDAPPHMDYPDDVKYPDTCQFAVNNDIIINTVQCGNVPDTKKYWLDICRLAEGKYVQIDATGGAIIAIETPFDKDLAKINEEMIKNTLVYGDAKMLEALGGLGAYGAGGFGGAYGGIGGGAGGALGGPPTIITPLSSKITSPVAGLPLATAADRAGYYGNTGKGTAFDLLQNIKDGKVKLEELKKEELPEEMRKMTLDEQKAFLEKVDKQRQELNAKARELDKKRSEYIAQKQKETAQDPTANRFDGQVMELLQQQAGRIQVEYGLPKKK